ncbi:hypothetical protein 1 [Wuhan arthropod virus 4]|uniref:hypothetical protein 1 n=1 Tax=Wuhan arthropod virus 4 TaxID=1923693 RepID=UPI00090C231E|nr:hypothetical protein 1 [Wuhan arthropod virus 4]APG75912.1 hypothetical protein 1 [Wuhan arthropod virus 4]
MSAEQVQTPVNFVLQAPAGAFAAPPPAESHWLVRAYKRLGSLWPLFLASWWFSIPNLMQVLVGAYFDKLGWLVDLYGRVEYSADKGIQYVVDYRLPLILGTCTTLIWACATAMMWKWMNDDVKDTIDREVQVRLLQEGLAKQAATQTVTDPVEFTPEKVKPSSILIKPERPTFQAAIYGELNGAWVRSGQAFKVRHQLITAYHVVESFQRLRLVTSSGEIDMASERFRWVEGDVAFCLLTPQENQILALTEAKLANHEFASNSGLIVKATGFNNSSYGFLKEYPAFGYVEYAGSTVPGFSGCPYVVGPKVYGMHLGGGVENLGLNGAYLDMLVRRKDESSEDYLFGQIEKHEKYDYQQSPYDPDEFRLRIGGKYYLIDADMLHSLETRQKGAGSNKVMFKDLEYDAEAYEYPTEEEHIPVYKPKEIPKIDDEIGKVSKEIAGLIKEISENRNAPTASKPVGAAGPRKQPVSAQKQAVARPKGTTSSSPKVSVTDGPELTPVQRSQVLQDIAKSLRTLRAEQPRLQQAISKKSSKSPQAASQIGRLISLNTELQRIISEFGLMTPLPTSTETRARDVASTSVSPP